MPSAHHHSNGLDQLLGAGLFEQVSQCSTAQSLHYIGLIVVHGENHHSCLGCSLWYPLQHLQPTQARHDHIEHQYIRAQFFDQAERRKSITGFAHYIKIGLLA